MLPRFRPSVFIQAFFVLFVFAAGDLIAVTASVDSGIVLLDERRSIQKSTSRLSTASSLYRDMKSLTRLPIFIRTSGYSRIEAVLENEKPVTIIHGERRAAM